MAKNDARCLPASAQQDIRFKAIRAIRAGKTQTEVAIFLGVSRQAIWKWIKQSEKNGLRSLRKKKQGRPSGGGVLLPWQAAQIAKSIVDKTPEQLKLPFYLWTREAVAQLIEKRFGIHLSIWTVGRYLARWGFTPQKPIRRAFERDAEAVKVWLKKEYPLIQDRAKTEGAGIYWGDEMGVRSDHAVGRSYGRRGKTPVIEGTGQRFRGNMISAITNRGKLFFMVFKINFVVSVFLNFLKRLIKQSDQKIFLILDGHPVHKAKKVRGWLKKHQKNIELFYLPKYSPELNPDEFLNQDVKSNAVGKKRPHTQKEMLSSLRSYLRGRQRRPSLVQRYFHAPSVKYAA